MPQKKMPQTQGMKYRRTFGYRRHKLHSMRSYPKTIHRFIALYAAFIIKFETTDQVECGGIAVFSVPCNRRVAGLNLPQATSLRPWTSCSPITIVCER